MKIIASIRAFSDHLLTIEGSIIDFIEFLSDFKEVVLPVGLLALAS